MASELIVAGYLNRETEFVHGLTGDCGPNAFHVLASWSDNKYYSTYTMYSQMRAHSPALCDANGDSTGNGLRTYAISAGFKVEAYYGYAGDTWSGWLAYVLAQLNAGRPVLIELAVGQNLKDWLTGKGENATNLKYHYITLVGYNTGVVSKRPEAAGRGVLPNGFWAADGDSFDSGNILQFITLASLSAAKPCVALSIARRVALPVPAPAPQPAPAPTPTGVTMTIPSGWHDDGTTLTAPNGVTVVQGFRDKVLADANWNPALWPLAKEYGTPTGTRQDFGVATIWTSASNVVALDKPTDFAGELASAQASVAAAQNSLKAEQTANATLQGNLTAAQTQATNLNTELTATKSQLDAAHQEISTLQAQLAAPVALPADAQAAVDYVKALVAANAAQAKAEAAFAA